MNFFIAIKPPTATAQEKQVCIVGGKPIFYDPAPVKEAKRLLMGHLIMHKPDRPVEGVVALSTIWLFPRGRAHKNGVARHKAGHRQSSEAPEGLHDKMRILEG